MRCDHRPALARDVAVHDVMVSRELILTPHRCLDCDNLVYVPHPTAQGKPWHRRDLQ